MVQHAPLVSCVKKMLGPGQRLVKTIIFSTTTQLCFDDRKAKVAFRLLATVSNVRHFSFTCIGVEHNTIYIYIYEYIIYIYVYVQCSA